MNYLKEKNLQSEALKNELHSLKNNKAPIICVSTAIVLRESLLHKLKEKVDADIGNRDLFKSIYLLELEEIVRDLRVKSLEVVENIKT